MSEEPARSLTVETLMELAKKAQEDGPRSSSIAPDHSYLSRAFQVRIARRFEKGGAKFGRRTYRQAFQRPANAPPNWKPNLEYMRDRWNHAKDHLLALDGSNPDLKADDNLAALGWFVHFAMEVEAAGIHWEDILQ